MSSLMTKASVAGELGAGGPETVPRETWTGGRSRYKRSLARAPNKCSGLHQVLNRLADRGARSAKSLGQFALGGKLGATQKGSTVDLGKKDVPELFPDRFRGAGDEMARAVPH